MPARKHREGAELEEWEAARSHRLKLRKEARTAARSMSGHALLRLKEAAEFLGVTEKTLREHERDDPNWPLRVRLSEKITGYRLMDLEALIDSGMVSSEPETAE